MVIIKVISKKTIFKLIYEEKEIIYIGKLNK